ncbi:amidohydrolase [Solimonas flava]|uniref:amidohydrolase n=1 Tax=Solimonas flava TaxID=415849 RepID=UPI000426D3F9|nr:amidohydrolase [Solimonas flava]
MPRQRRFALYAAFVAFGLAATAAAADDGLDDGLAALIDRAAPGVIADRRWLHQHPELSNREFETAKYVAGKLRALKLDVQTGVAHTGVVAVLRGGRPGPVIALRADMDALPVVEDVDVPFKSTVRTTYDGQDVGVMHACGHDGHMAILLGVAEVLAARRGELPGTVKFIFQPAEESAPPGEEGGAELMVKQGVLSREPRPEAIFGLHLFAGYEVGKVGYRAGGIMASSDDLRIVVDGKQTHGAAPWAGIDPIVAASQIVLGLQTIASRQMDVTEAPVIVTIGKIEGGVRNNIIPDRVEMKGTLRALDEDMRRQLHERVRRTAESTAAASGARASVHIAETHAYPVTWNDPALTQRMLPSLQRQFGARLFEARPMLGAEDFSFYQQQIPGLFLFVGVRPKGADPATFASNHSPRFTIDESALKTGVEALTRLAWDYLQGRTA